MTEPMTNERFAGLKEASTLLKRKGMADLIAEIERLRDKAEAMCCPFALEAEERSARWMQRYESASMEIALLKADRVSPSAAHPAGIGGTRQASFSQQREEHAT